jgi:hypothetical protein
MAHPRATKLDPERQAVYRSRGYHGRLRAFSGTEAARLRDRFLAYWRQNEDQLNALLPRERSSYLIETHLFLRWVYDIVAHPRILDAVESVLGPDILAWSSQWFAKFPGDGTYVSWHQDAAYWGLSPPEVTTAWVALTDSTTASGCMRVIPGSHLETLPQRDTYAQANMLSRGQEIAVAVDESRAVDLVLGPGEFSLHHVGIVHGSRANASDAPRIGLAIRYVAPEVAQQGKSRDMVLVVRGRDDHGHFDLVSPPDRDLDYGQSPLHAESLARKTRNLMSGPERRACANHRQRRGEP